MNDVVAVWRPPFASGGAITRAFPVETTIADMVRDLDHLPPDFMERGTVLIAGHMVERRHWSRVRARPGKEITFHYALAGGGDNGGKAVLGIVLAIATILTAGAALAGQFAVGGLFAAGSTSAKILAASISVVGQLAISAISAPPGTQQSQSAQSATDRERGPAAISGNLLQGGAPIPRVIGSRPIYPPLAGQPLVERVGQDEFAEAVFVLAGPHKIEDIRVGGSLIADAEDIDYEIREGFADDAPISLIERYARTKAPQLELSPHTVDNENQDRLATPTLPGDSLPNWHSVTTSENPDEVWLHLAMLEGIYNQASATQVQAMPIRCRIREVGETDWINLPELWFYGVEARQTKLSIRLKWADAPEAIPSAPEDAGFVAAYKSVAGQAAPATEAWTAASMFSAGSGSDGLYRTTEGSTNVRRVSLFDDRAEIFIDAATAPKGTYEVQVKRGMMVVASSFSKSAHTYSGSNVDFFNYTLSGSTPVITRSREGLADRLHLMSVASVINSHPIKGGVSGPGLALIAIRTRNRQIENLSVKASGYVRDWDGSGWNNWVVTSNPAVHYRDVLRGNLSPDPLPETIFDNAAIVAWRTACASARHVCDMVVEGGAVQEVLSNIASCGYARPYMSETWGVIRDYDRSAEDPVQVFTSRNSSELNEVIAFSRLPDAFRCIYRSEEGLGEEKSVIVWRPGRAQVANPRIEEIRYVGLTSEADVIARGEFDLAQAQYRKRIYNLKAPAEAIVCRRGSLIGINHDVHDVAFGAARIADVVRDGDTVTAVFLDSELPVYNEPDMHDVTDMHAVTDMHLVGVTTTLRIRALDGITTHHAVAGATGSRAYLQFAAPVSDDASDPVIVDGCLCWTGRPGKTEKRLIVAGIDFDNDLVASITAVDESPELWS